MSFFVPLEISSIVLSGFLVLLFSLSNFEEGNLIFDCITEVLLFVLEASEITPIVYILDTHYLNLEKKSTYTDSWTILYDDNPFNDINIYFNDKFLPCNIVFCDMDKLLVHTDIDKAYDWEKEEKHNRRFGGFQNWLKYYPVDDQIKEQFYIMYKLMDFLYVQDIDNYFKDGIQKYLDEYIFQLVKDNPDVEFDFVISPRCKLQLAIDIRTDSFQKMMYVLRAFVNENEKYKNLKLFAFDDEDAIGKVEDYKDGSHYRSWINYYILEAIKNNKNLITSSNYYDYLRNVFLQAKNVDFNEYKQQVQEIYVEK